MIYHEDCAYSHSAKSVTQPLKERFYIEEFVGKNQHLGNQFPDIFLVESIPGYLKDNVPHCCRGTLEEFKYNIIDGLAVFQNSTRKKVQKITECV